MLQNYLVVALRTLRQHKHYALINGTGLALGFACCLLVARYVQDELRFDRFHEKAARIVRIGADVREDGTTRRGALTQGILGPTLVREVPLAEAVVRFWGTGSVLRTDDRRFQEDRLFFADASVFDVFTFPLRRGNPATALTEPNTIVLTPAMAARYFGDADPIGRTLTSAEGYNLTVTGVLEEIPPTSHLVFDALLSMATVETTGPAWLFDSWSSYNVWTYVLLPDTAPATMRRLQTALAELLDRHAGDELRELERTVVLPVEPLPDLYLRSDRLYAQGPTGSLENLTLFASIAAFILLVACVNFVNLATARSTARAREVGVRKSVGASRGHLMLQFLGEAVLLALAALALALVLAHLALPAFNAFTGKALLLWDRPLDVLVFVGVAAAVGLLAGTYPAAVLSGFRPAVVLKGRLQASARGAVLRRGLVVLQLGISIALIAGTTVVFEQLGYMKRQNLGFDDGSATDEALLLLSFGDDEAVRQNLEAIKAAFADYPAVVGVTASQTAPGRGLPRAGGAVQDPTGVWQQTSINLYMIDFDFLDVYGMDLVAGRAFSPERPTDSTAYLLNETAVRVLGFPSVEEAVGKQAGFWGRPGEIIGVVRDFHHYSLHRAVEPMAVRIDPAFLNTLTLRLQTDDLPGTLDAIETLWNRLVPQRPFDYAFLDETFDAQYRAEIRFGRLFGVFAVLAIGIACLGLFGMMAFTTAQRTKEIGIRKVVGASVPQIVVLLTRNIVGLVGLALVLATPVMVGLMNRWLDGFAYRMDLSWTTFLWAGLTALGVALLTVSGQTLRAALANPVRALRHE